MIRAGFLVWKYNWAKLAYISVSDPHPGKELQIGSYEQLNNLVVIWQTQPDWSNEGETVVGVRGTFDSCDKMFFLTPFSAHNGEFTKEFSFLNNRSSLHSKQE